jgi:hypothetical protein
MILDANSQHLVLRSGMTAFIEVDMPALRRADEVDNFTAR